MRARPWRVGGVRPTARNTPVGCSGRQYTHWRGDFYPAELQTSRWFARYALTFDTVEINNSLYRLPHARPLFRACAAARTSRRRCATPYGFAFGFMSGWATTSPH